MITRHHLTLSIYGRVFFCVLPMELLRSLLGGEGGDVEATLDTWSLKLAAHLVGDDTHVEAEVDLDAGMYSKLRIEN
jgi:hypothetical protein